MSKERIIQIGQEVVWTGQNMDKVVEVLAVDDKENITVEIFGKNRIFDKHGFPADGYNDRSTLGCFDKKRLLAYKLKSKIAYDWEKLDLNDLEDIISKFEKVS